MSNWLANAIVAIITPYLQESTKEYIYIIFGVAGFMMSFCAWMYVPETMGKSLEDMVSFSHIDSRIKYSGLLKYKRLKPERTISTGKSIERIICYSFFSFSSFSFYF